MELSLLRFLAQTFSASFTSASRPGLTFFAVQSFAAVMVRLDMAVLPDALGWLVSFPAMGIAATLVVLELLAQHEEEVSELMRELKIDHLLGAFGAFSATLLFATLGLPESEAPELLGAASASLDDVAAAVQETSQTEHSGSVQTAAVGAGVSLNLVLTWVRGKVHEVLDEFDLKGIWQRIETGSVGGLLIVVIFLPVVALVVVVFMTVALFLVGLVISRVQAWRNQNSRIACDHCEHRVRMEAHRCPSCRGALVPSCNLGLPSSTATRFRQLKEAIFTRPLAAPSATSAELT